MLEPLDFLADDSPCARLVRQLDWARTPLGPMAGWPSELKAAVSFALASRFPKAIVWGPALTTIYNDAFRPILGNKPEAMGRSFADIWAEVWPEIGPIARRAYDGESTFIEDFPLEIDRSGQLEQCWFTFCYSPLRLADGRIAGLMDTVVETTASVRTRLELNVLNRELGHRIKNTLALVQAIATQTFRGAGADLALASFQERLQAMAHAQDVVVGQDSSHADLGAVAAGAVAPFNALQQIALHGAPVEIGPKVTMALTLILHELATNAIKYGALSIPQGRVALGWTVHAGDLILSWRESDGPPVASPTRMGFGSRLVDTAFGQGQVKRRYPTQGFEADILIPARNLLET
ncbi:sensor histidine kinase [Zavarzinia sp. CC-PAN008]|uniref:sensor histidine kinase n=1 Tax=Zavarzinia sp. CC-PAN008 TaxID=3243332 RepID=UPI003F74A6C1